MDNPWVHTHKTYEVRGHGHGRGEVRGVFSTEAEALDAALAMLSDPSWVTTDDGIYVYTDDESMDSDDTGAYAAYVVGEVDHV